VHTVRFTQTCEFITPTFVGMLDSHFRHFHFLTCLGCCAQSTHNLHFGYSRFTAILVHFTSLSSPLLVSLLSAGQAAYLDCFPSTLRDWSEPRVRVILDPIEPEHLRTLHLDIVQSFSSIPSTVVAVVHCQVITPFLLISLPSLFYLRLSTFYCHHNSHNNIFYDLLCSLLVTTTSLKNIYDDRVF